MDNDNTTNAAKPQDGNQVWMNQTVMFLEKAHDEMAERLERVEREIQNSVKRRDSIEMPGSVKDGPGYHVYHDITDEAGTRALVEAEIRSWQYAKDLMSGKATLPAIPTQAPEPTHDVRAASAPMSGGA